MIIKYNKKIYAFSSIVFLLSIVKLFLFANDISTSFLIVEFFIYIVFVLLLFYYDLLIRKRRENEVLLIDSYNDQIKNLNADKEVLLQRIDEFESRTVDEQKLVTYRNTVIKTLEGSFSNKHQNRNDFCNSLLKVVGKFFQISIGLCYVYDSKEDSFVCEGKYALDELVNIKSFKSGDGFNGQVVSDNLIMVVNDIPSDYFIVNSGLGSSTPKYLYLLPIYINDKVIGLLELGSFKTIRIDKMWEEINSVLVQYFPK